MNPASQIRNERLYSGRGHARISVGNLHACSVCTHLSRLSPLLEREGDPSSARCGGLRSPTADLGEEGPVAGHEPGVGSGVTVQGYVNLLQLQNSSSLSVEQVHVTSGEQGGGGGGGGEHLMHLMRLDTKLNWSMQ
jgi:hypothetical protein